MRERDAGKHGVMGLRQGARHAWDILNRPIDTWSVINRPIYVGDRLRDNLRALTMVGIFTAVLGIVLLIFNLATKQWVMAGCAVLTSVFGAGCAYFAGVMKNRRLAILSPTLFCGIVFAVYTLTGAMDGAAILWSFLLPIGICYFVSVKYGIILSAIYSLFFVVVFYTPLVNLLPVEYPGGFVSHFPVIFASMSMLNAIAMIQYHRGVLLEAAYSDMLNAEVDKQTRVARERADRLEELNDEMIQTLAVTIDAKDKYTNGHSFRVSWYSVALARHLGWSEDEIDELEREALLHDIGKIGVPDVVLNKPGRLTDDEFDVIKSHTTTGGSILSRSKDLKQASLVALFHHERYDGRGYPMGYAGDDIPPHARVVAIADAYDAMRSDRIYRKGLPLDIIREQLIKGRGTQFDPEFLDAFLELSDGGDLDEIAEREPLLTS